MPSFVADKNYYELFGLSPALDVDLIDLAERYRGLARQLHPDRFARGSELERRLAMQATTLINEAFQTLRSPILRAQYLLRLHGVELSGDTDTAMESAFLAEQIELRERLDDARHGVDSKTRLNELTRDVDQYLQAATDELRIHLTSNKDLEKARRVVREMQFLDKLRRQIRDIETELE